VSVRENERPVLRASDSDITAMRRYDLVETMRAYRDARFRPAVLRAYSYQCAVCDCALKLVDAAHIIPVSAPGSTDEVTNGLAMCRLHHGAYDNGLLGVCSDYRIITNFEQESHLGQLRLDMGLEDFKAGLPKKIRVPASLEVRPLPKNLRQGLKARRWPESLIA
jgi:putative restriction endonuclease